ncbi:hypothetical protein JCGZ_09312 [Jatropha curcas]|uniref:Auxin-responsive protein n=1 Tax=Jatropha curcas TaxID=180498 RepID=A0A067KT53_JATCU|nr:auxin-responsive protein IAA34 [Jatropha curcas]KDP35024.1 hypothetical protein JCGZ_09312 [Jatropha curcas]
MDSNTKEDDGIDLNLSLRTLQPEDYHPSSQFIAQGGMSGKRVKVYMDGVAIGRKVCIQDDSDYSMLALDLEHKFGPGLNLFRAGSAFSLLYKDMENEWKTLDGVTWRTCNATKDCKKVKLRSYGFKALHKNFELEKKQESR